MSETIKGGRTFTPYGVMFIACSEHRHDCVHMRRTDQHPVHCDHPNTGLSPGRLCVKKTNILEWQKALTSLEKKE